MLKAKSRRFYAASVARRFGVPAVEDAFAVVAREHFLGPGPWWTWVGPGLGDYLQTPDDDPSWLCQDITFALDRGRGINSGQPSLHARCLSRLGIKSGQRIAHIGAGSGYFTAILAELVGANGSVEAYEIDPSLARQAQDRLSERRAIVTVHQCDGASESALPVSEFDAIYVNASATGPAISWLKALRPGGRLLFPLSPTGELGKMLLLTQSTSTEFHAEFVMDARFIAAAGLQNPGENIVLAKAFCLPSIETARSLRVGNDLDLRTCIVRGIGWWLSSDLL